MTVVNLAAKPAEHIARLISKIYHHDTRKGKIIVGIVFALLGGAMFEIHPEHFAFIWDAFAGVIHGFGAAPILERALSILE